MKIFLDTGNLDEIRHAADLGVVNGVATNPTRRRKYLHRQSIMIAIPVAARAPVAGRAVASGWAALAMSASTIT
jgi:transaldolase